MDFSDEFPVATGPTKSSYSPSEEQAINMQRGLGKALDLKLEIMAAKLEVLDKAKKRVNNDIEYLTGRNSRDWHSAYKSALVFILDVLEGLAQEIKAELKD